MQYDICLKCNSLAALIAALAPHGLTTEDETGATTLLTASHGHALCYAGRVVQTPAEIDAEGIVVTEAVYWPGEYAILRAEEAVLDQIAEASLTGVVVLDEPPTGCPTFGDWSPRPAGPSLAELKDAACSRIEAKRQEREKTDIWINWPDGTKSIIQTRDERDWRNINGVASRGLFRLTQGLTEEDWFRDADNADHALLPPQAVDMGAQAAAGVSALAKTAQTAKDAINAPTVTTEAQVAEIEAGIVWPAN
ncbi:hypothetical protein [Solidesulfovibrio alcoholivorans]|uniref:DUF4376 domain-containing protein n=1 Tax=Solidesulfovibrio alcoholivorans TaxID=81406 RepID=UPI00049756A9|nr:hypothetical protein [Solidesulfovibrio alcoholivorans]